VQGSLFGEVPSDPQPDVNADVIEKIRSADIERLTPLEALTLLHELKKKIQ
jgi:hypothetical protein